MSHSMFLSAGLAVVLVVPLAAQSAPTSQPGIVHITRELEKPGRFAAHEATEVRWAALNRQHNFPHIYLALQAVSGASEVWWITPYPDLATMGKSSSFGAGNPAYESALGRIAAEDGEHLNAVSFIQARALPEASHGAFPDITKVRVYSVLTIQVRPGMEMGFTELAKAYAAMVGGRTQNSWRSYEVIAGMPAGTFMVFTSYSSWDAVQAQEQASNAAFAAAGPADMEAFSRKYRETVTSANNRYFTVNPAMSYPSKEMIAADPFWTPKPGATRRQ